MPIINAFPEGGGGGNVSVPDGVMTHFVKTGNATAIGDSVTRPASTTGTSSVTIAFYSLTSGTAYFYAFIGSNQIKFGTYNIDAMTLYKLYVSIRRSSNNCYITAKLNDKDGNLIVTLKSDYNYYSSSNGILLLDW